MLDLLTDAIGPAAPWLALASLAGVLAMRRRMRWSHVKALAWLAGLAFVGLWSALALGALVFGFSPGLETFLAFAAGLALVAGTAAAAAIVLNLLGAMRLDF
jgi:hypothetical protein